ncbi:bifunctional UDP-N-acetylglucosamine diphosphorylase/glucosamine-1-phosphate N-acetyltransferase GlmU [soil metagenome]
MAVYAIVLAAGKGTRMNSDLAKVLHRAAGRTLLDWMLASVADLEPERVVVVVGHQAEAVAADLPSGVEAVRQQPQNGTGHAVQVAMAHLGELAPDDVVVVGYGDTPLVPSAVYRDLATRAGASAAAMVTVDPGEPGTGRVLRDQTGKVQGIIEERDCDPELVMITERNAGIYAFRAPALVAALDQLRPDNSQGELYLTDVIAVLVTAGESVDVVAAQPDDVIGVNSHEQLAMVQERVRRRINSELMQSGVWMLDPDRTYIDAGTTIAPGARIYPGTYLQGSSSVGEGAQVGPDSFVVDSSIAAGATVWYSVVRQSIVGEEADVGPFASLRPGTVLERSAKAGTFVETKNTTIGPRAKVPHLAYMGDATIGEGANVGAGSITCNYDGYDKHSTVIGADAFIGSDTMLVAPVTIGDGAVTGAGSVITTDVEAGALAVERSPQQDIPGYADRRAASRRSRDAEEGT